MANTCFWEACIIGDRCSEAAEVFSRDYTRVLTEEKKIDIVPHFVQYKNLNRKNRKYIDNLSEGDRVDLLELNHLYFNDKELTDVVRKDNATLEDFRPWIDNFPGLVLYQAELVDRYIYVGEDNKSHMFGVYDVDTVFDDGDAIRLSGCCRWSLYDSMIANSNYGEDAPYALNLPQLAEKYGVGVTLRSIESGMGFCERIEVDESGKFIQDETLSYSELFDKDRDDFDSEDDWYDYCNEVEAIFMEELDSLNPNP